MCMHTHIIFTYVYMNIFTYCTHLHVPILTGTFSVVIIGIYASINVFAIRIVYVYNSTQQNSTYEQIHFEFQ